MQASTVILADAEEEGASPPPLVLLRSLMLAKRREMRERAAVEAEEDDPDGGEIAITIHEPGLNEELACKKKATAEEEPPPTDDDDGKKKKEEEAGDDQEKGEDRLRLRIIGYMSRTVEWTRQDVLFMRQELGALKASIEGLAREQRRQQALLQESSLLRQRHMDRRELSMAVEGQERSVLFREMETVVYQQRQLMDQNNALLNALRGFAAAQAPVSPMTIPDSIGTMFAPYVPVI